MNRKREFGRADRHKRAIHRFRLIVRLVILNRKWLIDAEEHKLSLNYKKNIAMLIRPQQKIGMLTLNEKALIRKLHENRTVADRKTLVHLLAGLPCFAILPPKVRARLVPIIKVIILDNGQVVIREGTTPMTVYFIVSGEIEVSKKMYDSIKKEDYYNVEFISGPGDCFGDIDLIENRAHRQYTYTATATTELLVVFDDDFDRILKPYMSEHWENKKKAFQLLEHFNFFNKDQIQTAGRLCILQQFEPLETIYYEDKGPISYAYFILCGECMILQRLRMKIV